MRSQQYALTVPADQLPELPVNAKSRTQRGALPDGISQEDAELAERMALVVNANCQFYQFSPFAVCGAIRDKYNAMGGPGSFLGLPTSPEYQNPGNTGARSEFLHGSIYWSAATGAHPITPLFMTKWAEHQWEAGWMGYPTTDEIPNGDNIGSRQHFETANAAMYWHATPLPGLAVIGGAIRDKWNSMGAVAGPLGYPITDEVDTFGPFTAYGQRMNAFFGGGLYFDFPTARTRHGQWIDTIAEIGDEEFDPENIYADMPLPAGFSPHGPESDDPQGPFAISPRFQSPCPSGTTSYTGDFDKFNCVVRYKDLGGTWWNVRKGAPGNKFGQWHYQNDHHVKDRWVELMMQDNNPVKLSDKPSTTRWAFATEFYVGDEYDFEDHYLGFKIVVNTEGLNIKDSTLGDGQQFGLVTAHCYLPKKEGQPETKIQYCPDSMPPGGPFYP